MALTTEMFPLLPSGIFGVYITGYILHLTGSWISVFQLCAAVCVLGTIVYIIFGSGEKVV